MFSQASQVFNTCQTNFNKSGYSYVSQEYFSMCMSPQITAYISELWPTTPPRSDPGGGGLTQGGLYRKTVPSSWLSPEGDPALCGVLGPPFQILWVFKGVCLLKLLYLSEKLSCILSEFQYAKRGSVSIGLSYFFPVRICEEPSPSRQPTQPSAS